MAADLNFDLFKKQFYDQVKDLSILNCLEFNLLKVVLDGLKVDYVASGILKTRFTSSTYLFRLTHHLRGVKYGKKLPAEMESKWKEIGKRKHLLIDHSARTARAVTGKTISFYFSEILESAEAKNIAHIVEKKPNLLYDYDCCLPQWTDCFRYTALDADDKELHSALIDVYRNLDRNKCFAGKDLINIGIAFEKFFYEYKTWKQLLGYFDQKQIHLLCHYHREGSMLAMRRAGREIIEWQHGLISTKDIFYCFPQMVSGFKTKCLFSDKIWVYGTYWKEVLLSGHEFAEDQIEIRGFYPFDRKVVSEEIDASLKEWIGGRTVLLVTTQTTLHTHFISYLKNLLPKLNSDKQVVLLRPHPAEKKELYAELETFHHCRIETSNLSFLLDLCDLHLSVYSTTIYDAIRFGKPSFSLEVASCMDYISDLVKAGVTKSISADTNVFEQVIQTPNKTADYYFAKSNYRLD
jgi:hypothetical protein